MKCYVGLNAEEETAELWRRFGSAVQFRLEAWALKGIRRATTSNVTEHVWTIKELIERPAA
jgi:hypothetical protein